VCGDKASVRKSTAKKLSKVDLENLDCESWKQENTKARHSLTEKIACYVVSILHMPIMDQAERMNSDKKRIIVWLCDNKSKDMIVTHEQ
jgi:hypothetical protein